MRLYLCNLFNQLENEKVERNSELLLTSLNKHPFCRKDFYKLTSNYIRVRSLIPLKFVENDLEIFFVQK
jgi:hypothetical protein